MWRYRLRQKAIVWGARILTFGWIVLFALGVYYVLSFILAFFF